MTSLDEPLVLRDVAVVGDVTLDPQWRELLGVEEEGDAGEA